MARQQRQRSRAQSMVEFAVLAPIFFLLLLGTIDLGRAVYIYNSISDAAREGARATVPYDYPLPTSATLVTAVQSKLGGGFSLLADPCIAQRSAVNNACPTPDTASTTMPSNTGYIWYSPVIPNDPSQYPAQPCHCPVTIKISFLFQPWIPVVRDAAGNGVILLAETTMVTEY